MEEGIGVLIGLLIGSSLLISLHLSNKEEPGKDSKKIISGRMIHK